MWYVGELTKQEEAELEETGEEKVKKKRESETVYFTRMGSRSRKTDHYEIWQSSSSDQHKHSFQIWY